jgi:nucleotide-binding universal stress UspA family protein
MFKSIQISLTGQPGDARALDAGFSLARASDAHADCLHVRFDPVVVAARTSAFDVPGIDASRPFLDALEREDKQRTEAAKKAFDEACRTHGMTVSRTPSAAGASAAWVELTGDEYADTIAEARYRDILVADRAAEFGEDSLGAIAVACGRPVLVPASSGNTAFGRTIAIAWKDSAEAARAVTAAMPMLAEANRVIVICADETGNAAAARLKAAERLAHQLRWHGIKGEGRIVVPGGRATAAAVIEEAATLCADMVVMGAYGHSRAREIVFGGVTRDVLKAAALPVLLCH